MPTKAEVLKNLDAIDDKSLTTAAWRQLLNKKRQGRTPDFAYQNLQDRINKVAPTIKANHWKGHSFASAVYESFLLEGNKDVQKPAQIVNLIRQGKLVLPAQPAMEEVK